MQDVQNLIKSKKFYDAVKLIVGRRLPGATPDAEIIGKVSEVAVAALRSDGVQDLQKIIKYAARWVDAQTKDLVSAHLLETTAVEDITDLDETDLIL